MYSAKRANDRRIDLKAQFNLNEALFLNIDRSVALISELKPSNPKRKLIVKIVQLLSTFQQIAGAQDAILRKMYASSIYYLKPECYDFIGDSMYLCYRVQGLSLQSVLWIHRMQKMRMGRQFVRQFTVKMYEGLARLKSTDIFPNNLKPTNIFLEYREEERDWVWGEAGLHTNRRNQFYSKMNLQALAKNNSVKIELLEMEFYALGVILLEMITLESVDRIDKLLRKREDMYTLESYGEAETYYGHQITTIIGYFLNPPKDSSLTKIMQEYKDGDRRQQERAGKSLRREFEEEPDYSVYWLTAQRLQGYFQSKNQLIMRVQKQAKQFLQQSNCSCREVFDKIAVIDPEFSFTVMGMGEFRELLSQIGVKLSADELLFVTSYYTVSSAVRYFKLIQRIFQPKELIENIIAKAVDSYDSFKDFFEAQTNGREFWKSEEIKLFLQTLDVPFEDKQVNEVVRNWTNGTRTSVKYDELYKVFKPILGMSMSLSTIKKPKSELVQGKGSALQRLIQLLLQKQPDLIGFFRRYDLKQTWILDYKIEKVIRGYVKAQEEVFRRGFAEMWEKGSIPGDMTKQINYVYLVRNLGLYEPVELFRMILTQKINESNREEFFEKYRREEKGWNLVSFFDFNRDENLDFQDRELKALFSELDTDRSGTIEERELVYRLTGLKEFDYGMVVENISEAIKKKGVNLFRDFKQLDPRGRLFIGNLKQFRGILQNLGVELSEDHLDKLFNKFARSGQFQYMVFLREFYNVYELFLWGTQFMLQQHYRGDFEKLFPIGLREGRKKWNRQSLVLVNEEMDLRFREVELGEIWSKMDPNQEGSLTKEQVAAVFDFEVQKREELTRKAVESIKDLPKRKGEGEKDGKKSDLRGVGKQKQGNKQKQVIEEVRQLGEKKILSLAVGLFEESEDSGRVELQRCLSVFQKAGLRCKRGDLMSVVGRFKQQKGSKTIVNYVLLLFYLLQEMFKQEEGERYRYKAQMSICLMRQVKRSRSWSNEEIFGWCRRKDRMRLSDFEEVFRRMVDRDVYFEDLEEVWRCWGEPDSLTLQEFDKLLRTNEFKLTKDKESTKEKSRKDIQQEKYDKADRSSKQDKFTKRGRSDRQTDNQRQRIRQLEEREVRGNKKLKGDNRMRDFVQNSDADTPDLNRIMSFGERAADLSRGQSSHRASEKDRQDLHQRSDTGNNIKQTAKFRGDSKGRVGERQRETSERLRQPAKKSSFHRQPKEERIDLQEQVAEKKKDRGNSKRDEQSIPKKSDFSKTSLIDKLRKETEESGNQYMNELFSKSSVVEVKKFVNCLCIHYGFEEEEAVQLGEMLSTFNKIKLQSLRKELGRETSKDRQATSKEKDKAVKKEFEQKPMSPDKKSSSFNKERQKEGRKLVDPRRQKINVPLVREHFRLLLGTFLKKYERNELQSFFFEEQETIGREQFVRKSQKIDGAYKEAICERIFDYLKPDAQDRIGMLSFKLGMGMEEVGVNQESEDFLPEELERELKAIFEKADKDRSGTIQPNELEGLMSSLGFNQNIKQIESYFSRIDQNYDNKISYSEFRRFIEDQILPQLSNFDEQEEELQEMLRNNDIFRHGSLSAMTLQAVLERYGVKLGAEEMGVLVRGLNGEGQEVRINQLLLALRQPTAYSSRMKGILYRIRLRKKVQLKEVQKVFESISSCFVLAYTAKIIERQILNVSTPFRLQLHECGLFFNDLAVKDVRKVGQEEGIVAGQIASSDLLVQLLMKEISGVPIPQKAEIKSNIKRRYINVCIFDLSSEMIKNSVWQVQVEWDPEVQDVWTFSSANRSLFVKIGGYEQRKYDKYVVLFELVIDAVEGGRTLEINCGCATMPLRELLIPEGKTAKKLKLIAGLPSRAKEIDRTAISKRGGWTTFFGGDIVSELQLELIHQSKFKDSHRMIAALPSQCIVARKALHYLWVYREFLAQCAFQGGSINSLVQTDVRVSAFVLTLDVPQLFLRVWPWWKEKVSKVKSLKQAKTVLRTLLQELYLVVNSKQFELLRKCPAKPILHNGSLLSVRNKMITQVLENVENWLNSGVGASYRRRKTYNVNYGPLQLYEIGMTREHRLFMQNLVRLSMR